MRVLRPLVVACALFTSGFSAQGQRWQNPSDQPVPYQLDPLGSDDIPDDSELAALRRAFNTWEEVSCSYLKFAERNWTTPRVVQNDGTNRIFWVDTQNQWPGQDATLALTYVFYSLDDSRAITDADMIFNGLTWTWTTVDSEIGQGTPGKVDVETVAFHEAGHFLGLDHSNDPEAAMYPSNNKMMQRSAAQDDVQGVCSLYPNGQPVPGQTPGTGNGGPIGAPCTSNPDCASSLCAQDDEIGRSYCTAECAVANPGTCPAGFPCTATSVGDYCLAAIVTDELCDFCSNGNQCSSGLCVGVPFRNFGQPFCTKPCDPANPSGQCPGGYQCELTQLDTTQIGVCVPNSGVCSPSGKGGHNEACYANGTCKAGHMCLEWAPGSGITYCFAECAPGVAGCGYRQECTAVAGRMNTYVCLTKAGIGEPCLPEVCLNNAQCLFDETLGVDSALCYASCTSQAQCQANTMCVTEGLAVGACVPGEGFKYDGQPCQSGAECESTVCTVFGDNKLCTRECSTSNEVDDCSPGLRCLAPSGTTQGFCWPEAFDTNEETPRRNITTNISGYCACDTSNSCDSDCDCDPECGGGTCSCTTTGGDGAAWPALALAFLVLALRRRR
ncbi:MAG: matrixin family metalloprotease [Deltaproteobacteria bacterium]|jgi:MYXO-CTERM domain-containing protein